MTTRLLTRIRVLLPALLIASAMALPATGSKQQAPPKEKQQPTQQTPPTTGVPRPTVPALDNKIATDKQKDSSSQESGGWPPWRDLFWPNWALVIVGGFAAFAALRTLGAIREQSEATWESAHAARLNAQAALDAERAWVVVRIVEENWNNFTVEAANHGRTPARIIGYDFGSLYAPYGERDVLRDTEYTDSTLAAQKLLVPGVPWIFETISLTREHTKEAWDKISQRKQTIVYHGRIRYMEIGDTIRETRFCYAYSLKRKNFITAGKPKDNSYT